jgi:hypothetical protein
LSLPRPQGSAVVASILPPISHGHGSFRTMSVLFIWLIIHLIRLVFSAGTVFFSHKKSANGVFQPAYNSSRTGPSCLTIINCTPVVESELIGRGQQMKV